jgi:polar amino acid transport system ATP-binding protein
MIELVSLRKEYENVTPLTDVNAVINDGDIVSVIGTSGMGKTTLLRCINMLERPTSGQILINGEDITKPGCDLGKVRQKMGMVFQSFNLFEHLTVIENIMVPQIDLLGRSRQEAYEEGMRLLRIVGLSERAFNYPDEMSGGQKQRVAIARTLAMDPDTILLDEPTSALDPTMVGEVQTVIRGLAKMGKTMMIVTHEMNFARSIANRVFYLDEGGIYEEGTPEEIFDHPVREKTRRFIHKLKVLELEIREKDYDFIGLQTEIEGYCRKNLVPYRVMNHIQLAFEEMTQQILVPGMSVPDIDCTIEYSADTQKALLTVDYGGERFDPSQDEDNLSLSVLRGAVSDIGYEWLPEADRKNRLVMTALS